MNQHPCLFPCSVCRKSLDNPVKSVDVSFKNCVLPHTLTVLLGRIRLWRDVTNRVRVKPVQIPVIDAHLLGGGVAGFSLEKLAFTGTEIQKRQLSLGLEGGDSRAISLSDEAASLASEDKAALADPMLVSFCAFTDCPTLSDYRILNVTGGGFQVSWRLNSTQNHTFYVRVYRGEELLRSARTRGLALAVSGLEAGVLYRVKTGYQGCGADISTTMTVKTGKTTSRRPPLARKLAVLCPRPVAPALCGRQ
ncbi:hypothetical protein P7K49_032618 [Saguinus oedipus]|uniref:Fibronectin type-III domain-containing protein n=1 Tax=Saguinus oedipus TaxID=9490 RepID=A0ABQ9TYQ8_SAGOE|nr:hypothetical protein P7K49_032618 [Saguinus oedipus]